MAHYLDCLPPRTLKHLWSVTRDVLTIAAATTRKPLSRALIAALLRIGSSRTSGPGQKGTTGTPRNP